ncbi:aldo/keto reductase [Rathayibacter soli]|uniref:aldo/keto reductase n=1 Tax=Rathayibacter soli TaxID=3144168 RepID=UPI0027E5B796|nr:aldo/keto reductase [Glaciibacter superstes]
MDKLKFGILGLGKIAHRFARELSLTEGVTLHAVASRDADKARDFGRAYGALKCYDSYEGLLNDPEVDAVYIATVHTTHTQLSIRAAEAGKHILCEKPMGVNQAAAMTTLEAVRRAGVAFIEGYMYRFHPQMSALLELVAQGAIGTLQHIDASYSFRASHKEGRLFDVKLAGGAILDVGGYPVSMVLGLVKASTGSLFLPRVEAEGMLGDSGVDEWTSASLSFASGITAHISAGIGSAGPNDVHVYGSKGSIHVENPWVVAADERPTVTVRRSGEDEQRIRCDAASAYAREADALGAAIGTKEAPQMPWAESLVIANVLDQWRNAIGLRYPFEHDDANIPTATGRPLSRRESAMKYGTLSGSSKDISCLVMGCDNQSTLAHATAMFDDYFERGGNAFDTAHEYNDGLQEKLLGQWIRNRGVRDDVFLIGKGAHTPYCDPGNLSSQLLTSLDRMQTDYVDLYFMHRDNESIPVGEFIDVLDEHYRAGRIRAFGGSNWSVERFTAANEYAAEHGKQGFTALSNHFGLAEAYALPWAGCRHVTDQASKRWLAETGTPLFPWSSQARGFFARADPSDTSDAELVRCYYSDSNFERLRRTRQLASEFGVSAMAVALAYVLQQPFPTFPLIGPRTIEETRTSLDALKIDLTPEHVRWLDLRD